MLNIGRHIQLRLHGLLFVCSNAAADSHADYPHADSTANSLSHADEPGALPADVFWRNV